MPTHVLNFHHHTLLQLRDSVKRLKTWTIKEIRRLASIDAFISTADDISEPSHSVDIQLKNNPDLEAFFIENCKD